jgi:hypothetical protein
MWPSFLNLKFENERDRETEREIERENNFFFLVNLIYLDPNHETSNYEAATLL